MARGVLLTGLLNFTSTPCPMFHSDPFGGIGHPDSHVDSGFMLTRLTPCFMGLGNWLHLATKFHSKS